MDERVKELEMGEHTCRIGIPSMECSACMRGESDPRVGHAGAALVSTRDVAVYLREAREALREAFLVISRHEPLSHPAIKQINRASDRIDAALSGAPLRTSRESTDQGAAVGRAPEAPLTPDESAAAMAFLEFSRSPAAAAPEAGSKEPLTKEEREVMMDFIAATRSSGTQSSNPAPAAPSPRPPEPEGRCATVAVSPEAKFSPSANCVLECNCHVRTMTGTTLTGAPVEHAESCPLEKPWRPPDPAPAVAAVCTGLTAAWCPVHGDCRCPGEGGGRDLNDPGCPLHSPESTHADAPAAASAGLARPEGRLLFEAEEKLGDALDASEHAPECPAPSVGLRGCGCWRTLVFQALDRLRAVTLKTAARQPAEWEQDYVCSSCCAPKSFGHDKCLGTPENLCDCIKCLRAASAGEGALREALRSLPPVARGDSVTLPREQYERARNLLRAASAGEGALLARIRKEAFEEAARIVSQPWIAMSGADQKQNLLARIREASETSAPEGPSKAVESGAALAPAQREGK